MHVADPNGASVEAAIVDKSEAGRNFLRSNVVGGWELGAHLAEIEGLAVSAELTLGIADLVCRDRLRRRVCCRLRELKDVRQRERAPGPPRPARCAFVSLLE